MNRPERDDQKCDKAVSPRRGQYQPPSLEVFRDGEILDLVGPAQTYGSSPLGSSGGGGVWPMGKRT